MLSPKSHRFVLLPEDYAIMDHLGLTEAEYRDYVQKVSKITTFRPGEPTAFLVVPFLITLAVGVVLNYVASLLAPKQKQSKPAQLDTKTVDGQNIVRNGRFAPRSGFDNPQNVVELGSIVPIVFAKREVIDNKAYGGVRINTNLLWSQTYSLGTAQLLRSVFMLGGSKIGAIDPYQIAIGDNLLSQYELDPADNDGGRISVYYRNDGAGRIVQTNHIAGRLPVYDEGNAQRSGGSDVYAIRGINNAWTTDFCYTSKPSNQTTFGLYAGCGNGLGYRVNPTITPASVPQPVPQGDNGNSRVVCTHEPQVRAQRLKQNAVFSSRSGIVRHNSSNTDHDEQIELEVGDTFTYVIENSTDYDLKFYFNNPGNSDGEVTCIDVAQSVAGRQRAWDDSIVVGELYKFGQVLAVCIDKEPDDEIFVSAADREPAGGGQSIEAKFRVVRVYDDGKARFTSYDHIRSDGNDDVNFKNGTQTSQLFRVAVASFVVDRPTQVIEVGIKSVLGIRYSGMMNYRDATSYEETDSKNCDNYEGQTIGKGETFTTTAVTSGTYTGPDIRYSFHKIGYRIGGSDDDYTYLDQLFGFRSQTQEASYNSFRIEFPSAQRWEVEIVPISGWEIRSNVTGGDLVVISNKTGGRSKSVKSNGAVIRFSGETVARSSNTFELVPTIPKVGDLGIPKIDGRSYVDNWGKLAELYMMEEVQSSAASPEHEIAYINLISKNTETPLYQNLTLLGINIRSGPSIRELSQVSAYVTKGYSDDLQGIHLFPSCAYKILTDPIFGTGDVVSPLHIDKPSFDYCDAWTYERKYFFDIGISDPDNAPTRLAAWAQNFLLDLMRRGGKYYLEPVAEFGKVYSPVAMYTSGNINLTDPDDLESDSTLEVSYRELSARQKIRVSVKWREERLDSDVTGRGLFPIIRELNVRETGTPENATLVQLDLSEFCTSELHALDVAKMECRKRLITHDVKFEIVPEQAPLQPGAIIQLGVELLTYDTPNNGVILSDGTVIFNGESNDGVYEVALWDGIDNDIQEAILTVVDGKVTGYSNAVFTLANVVAESQIFKVQKLDFTTNGDIDVVASYYPLDENGYSKLLENWNDPDAWIIEGLIGDPPEDEALVTTFEGVQIQGPNTVTAGESLDFTSFVEGPAASYTYAWSGSGMTIATPTANTTSILFPNSGTYTITLSVNNGTTTKTDTHIVTVRPIDFLGVTINGPITGEVDIAYNFTSTINGPAGTYTYAWSSNFGTPATPTAASTNITFPGSAASFTPAVKLTVTNASGIQHSDTHLIVLGGTEDPGDGGGGDLPGGVVIVGPTSVATATPYSYTADNLTGLVGGWTYEWEVLNWNPTLTDSTNSLQAAVNGNVFDIEAVIDGVSYAVEVG